jgi:hypothetical protein
VKLTIHPDIVPRLRVSGAVPPLLLYAFISRTVTDNMDRQCLTHTAFVRNNKLKLPIPFRTSVTTVPLVNTPVITLSTYLLCLHKTTTNSPPFTHQGTLFDYIARRSGARRRHLPEVASQPLTFNTPRRFQSAVRPSAAETQPSLRYTISLASWWSLHLLSLRTHDVKVLSLHHCTVSRPQPWYCATRWLERCNT